MKSIRSIFKIGHGPSSSHTMGPSFAAERFLKEYPEADLILVFLYGSLAKTGKGHGTDRAIEKTLSPVRTEIIFAPETETPDHPNTMDFIAFRQELGRQRFYSIGGGEIRPSDKEDAPEIYPERSFTEISQLCKSRNIRLSDFVFEREGEEIKQFLFEVWQTMLNAIQQGLVQTGELPGGLALERKAQLLYNQRHIDESPQTRENRLVCSYAFAVSEQNADCGIIVTPPAAPAAWCPRC